MSWLFDLPFPGDDSLYSDRPTMLDTISRAYLSRGSSFSESSCKIYAKNYDLAQMALPKNKKKDPLGGSKRKPQSKKKTTNKQKNNNSNNINKRTLSDFSQSNFKT